MLFITFIRPLTFLASLCIVFAAKNDMLPVLGTKCLPNQVVTKLTVYDDGAIEAECNKLPCGIAGSNCNDNQKSCRAETDTFSGMKWANNGQSILQRCCALVVARKIYVGTDLVTLGSYYNGGLVDKKDLYSKEGIEFDFVSNIRTEQGGVRVWVYRVICPKPRASAPRATAETETSEQMQTAGPDRNLQVDPAITQGLPQTPYRPINPLQYRPPRPYQHHPQQQRDSPIGIPYRAPSERLI